MKTQAAVPPSSTIQCNPVTGNRRLQEDDEARSWKKEKSNQAATAQGTETLACPTYFVQLTLIMGPFAWIESSEQKHIFVDQDQNSMLKVICNQRDRFQARLRETEEEVRRLKDKIRALTEELEKTKADNVKLYGKIRYVQDYNHEKVVSRGSKRSPEDLESSDVESKYKKMYEEDINPLAAFSKKVSDQSSGNNLHGQSGAPSTSNSQVN